MIHTVDAGDRHEYITWYHMVSLYVRIFIDLIYEKF